MTPTQPRTRSGRLVEVSEDFLLKMAQEANPGYRVALEWGEPDEEGVYTPIIRTQNLEEAVSEYREALDRLFDAASVEEEDWSPQTHDELVAALNQAGALLQADQAPAAEPGR